MGRHIMKLSLNTIATAVHGELVGDDRLVSGVSIDTRTIPAGHLYINILTVTTLSTEPNKRAPLRCYLVAQYLANCHRF